MKKCVYPFLFASLLWGFFAPAVQAQDLVYKPANPAFGGETFNYNWLLAQAQAQDLITDPAAQENGASSSQLGLDDFTSSLNRQLLSQLSRELITNQFGENGLEDGQYTVGNFSIDVFSTIEGLNITITDINLGEQTQIVIPFF